MKEELQAQVEHLKLRADAERMLKIAAPTHTHNNPFTGSTELYKQKKAELEELNAREEAAEFYGAYLAHCRTQAYAEAGQIDRSALDELEAKHPALAYLRQRRAK